MGTIQSKHLSGKKNRLHTSCDHCGEVCPDNSLQDENGHQFCCQGCQTVYTILQQNDLLDFYAIDAQAGRRKDSSASINDEYDWLNLESLASQFYQYRAEDRCRVLIQLPAIHCVSCVWLLERLDRLLPGILSVRINFGRREATILFDPRETNLTQIAQTLDRIGYPPSFQTQEKKKDRQDRHQLYKIGYAGFAFGNIMLLSLPEYFGLAADTTATFFGHFVGYLILLLSLPLVFYAGRDYLINAWSGLSQRKASLDIPIAIGIIVLFSRSAIEILFLSMPGYLDSLAGLIFFLLVGRWFQSLTYERLSFDSDHQDYFPLAAELLNENGTTTAIAAAELAPDQMILVKPGQLIPADGILVSPSSVAIDYSFVSGEALPQQVLNSSLLYAGGRVNDVSIKVKLTKKPTESYLLQLWQSAGTEQQEQTVTVSERLSRFFTIAVLAIALLTFAYWFTVDQTIAFNAATAVLIIACPCALALAAPFAYGSMMRAFGRAGLFLRSAKVLDRLQEVDQYVFDKTGTLISANDKASGLTITTTNRYDLAVICAMCSQSDHPRSKEIIAQLAISAIAPVPIGHITETAGQGLQFTLGRKEYRVGKASFCGLKNLKNSATTLATVDGKKLLTLEHQQDIVSQEISQMLEQLPGDKRHLLSGDRQPSTNHWHSYFANQNTHFEQSPFEKEAYIQQLQTRGHQVLMMGDGINDTGALRAASVGFAVSHDLARFSPASDGIIIDTKMSQMHQLISAARRLPWVLRTAYTIALLYNLLGLSYAVTGQLSPVVAAILMPVSSITVVIISVAGSWIACSGISKK